MKLARLSRGLNLGDAQDLLCLWQGLPPAQSIATSPPYLDMHDYGNDSQIGVRGQSVEKYQQQMLKLFRDCYRIASPTATFWLVAGSVRRDRRLLTLPERLATCAEEAGWILREAITWDKQKSLPWTHHGELRDITEQVLLFSKGTEFRFDPSQLRSPIPNSIWWRRYPERYSPNGTMPTNLWSIPIPTQGSWSPDPRTHFCPFPEELTYRMLSLTTVEGDTVLDPMAGIGSVPAMAEAMGRVGYGLELTADYTRLYKRTARSAASFLSRIGNDTSRREDFRRTIIELRILKFAKLLAREIKRAGLDISWVRAKKSRGRPRHEYQVASARFDLVLGDESVQEAVLNVARTAIQRPPLSKFGIDAKVASVSLLDAAIDGYWYQSGRFWNEPGSKRPLGDEPHVVARFRPDPDQVDDTPYV